MELKFNEGMRLDVLREVLIAPLWNWNHDYQVFHRAFWWVLIAPLWNWNKGIYYILAASVSSNRTFMELKCQKWQEKHCYTDGSNRTFMELKSVMPLSDTPQARVLIAPLWNWNYTGEVWVPSLPRVLIAPLWNWNSSDNLIRTGGTCSNRTFMELKFIIVDVP